GPPGAALAAAGAGAGAMAAGGPAAAASGRLWRRLVRPLGAQSRLFRAQRRTLDPAGPAGHHLGRLAAALGPAGGGAAAALAADRHRAARPVDLLVAPRQPRGAVPVALPRGASPRPAPRRHLGAALPFRRVVPLRLGSGGCHHRARGTAAIGADL